MVRDSVSVSDRKYCHKKVFLKMLFTHKIADFLLKCFRFFDKITRRKTVIF